MAQISQALDQLEQSIAAFKVETSRFLAGDLELPPLELGSRIRANLRLLREETRSTADGFRLQGLEARLGTYSELFNKRAQNAGARSSLRGGGR